MLVDSHCHLDFFKKLKPVITRAVEKNVKTMVSCATNTNSIKNHLQIQKQFLEIHSCIGIHPADLLRLNQMEIDEGLKLIEKNAANCTGIGEIGLDYKYATTKEQKDLQEKIFRLQIIIALQNDLPLVVHSRYAEQRAIDVLKEEGAKKVLMHWFTNSAQSVKTAVKAGFFVSCGPIILSSGESRKIAKKMPLEKLVLETDAPVSFMGKQSEPFWIERVLEKLAETTCTQKEVIAKKTTENALNLFSISH